MRTTSVTIGTTPYLAACIVPRFGIGFWEAIGLSLRGRFDARVTREVRDTEPTHTLHRLQAGHRHGEAEAVRRIDEALSAVDRALAPLASAIGEPEPDAPRVPAPAELDALPAAEHANWAARVRDAKAAQSRASARRQQRDAALREQAVLLSIRRALVVEGADVSRQWREAYAMRAARYTRARFRRRSGALMSGTPSFAAYPAVEGPTAEREEPGRLADGQSGEGDDRASSDRL